MILMQKCVKNEYERKNGLFSDKIVYKIKIDPLMMRIWYENV